MDIPSVTHLRQTLHRYPELSGQEIHTAKRIKEFITASAPDAWMENLGGNGLAALFSYAEKGPVIVIRCEMDALPITENGTTPYQSVHPGLSHSCGHDGHMAIVAGLAPWLREKQFKKGKVVLLFQPSEETGEGAYAVLRDQRFTSLQPDYIFALHNIPGIGIHKVIMPGEIFSACVHSFIIRLNGREAHAAEPEKGCNPSLTMAALTMGLNSLEVREESQPDFTMLTPVYQLLGKPAYGISPGYGEMHYTMRCRTDSRMDRLKEDITRIVGQAAEKDNIEARIEWLHYFPPSMNKADGITLVQNAALKIGLELENTARPFRFGEDFGWYSRHFNTTMFGLGAGITTPALHQPAYDFPDELLESGSRMFKEVIGSILA